MTNLLLRMLYAGIAVFMLFWLVPIFLVAVGFPTGGSFTPLVKPVIACVAVLYVLFGPPPPKPW